MSSSADSEIVCQCPQPQVAVRKTCKQSEKHPENIGRDFYACPVGTRAYGGCGFFAWAARQDTADGSASPPPSQARAPVYSTPLRPVAVNEPVRRPFLAGPPKHVGLSRPNQPSATVAALSRAEAHDAAAMERRLEAMEKQMVSLKAMMSWLETQSQSMWEEEGAKPAATH